MTIHPGMLIFCILDSCIAFLLVFFVSRARLGGSASTLARIFSSLLGTITFILYFCTLIWFNTTRNTVSDAAKTVTYVAPIVLSLLMIALTWLSQPPKKQPDFSHETDKETDTEDTE